MLPFDENQGPIFGAVSEFLIFLNKTKTSDSPKTNFIWHFFSNSVQKPI